MTIFSFCRYEKLFSSHIALIECELVNPYIEAQCAKERIYSNFVHLAGAPGMFFIIEF